MWNDTIDQGATFYREVTLFSDKAKTQRLSLVGRLPRAALMLNGNKVADMPCAVKDVGGVVAWTLPKAAGRTLKTGIVYDWFLYLDDIDDENTYPAERGKITVNPGV